MQYFLKSDLLQMGSKFVHQNVARDFYRTQVSLVRCMGSSLSKKVREVWFNLTDVTQADEDTNSILTDNANRAFQRNMAMQ